MLPDRNDSHAQILKKIMAILSLMAMAGCSYSIEHIELEGNRGPRLTTGTLSAPAVRIPKNLTKPTESSKRIRMGSRARAEDFLCTHMSHYTLALNANFDSTLNVFKHRAARMGADWLYISKHSEVTARAEANNNRPIFLVAGSTLSNEHEILTKIEGDLYDCK